MRKLLLALPFLAAPAAQAATVTTSATVAPGGLLGVTFELGAGASFLDISTNGSTNAGGGGRADTVIALFAGTGRDAPLVASDDDDGDLGRSFLRFGMPGMGATENPQPGFFDGGAFVSDGAAPGAGTFTLVVFDSRAGFAAPDLLGGFASGAGGEAIDARIRITSDAFAEITGVGEIVPAPLPAAGGMLAGALAILALRRARRRA